jgi:hypothetical protein
MKPRITFGEQCDRERKRGRRRKKLERVLETDG